MQSASANTVLAVLIFLNLLESDPERLAKLRLAHLAPLAQKANARTNCLVNWIVCRLPHVPPPNQKARILCYGADDSGQQREVARLPKTAAGIGRAGAAALNAMKKPR